MQRQQPDHLYSEVIKSELKALQHNHLVEQQTRLIGTHAAVTQYLDENKALEARLKKLNIKYASPYPEMVGPALSGAFFLGMLVHEREPWKMLVLFVAVTAMIYQFVRQPGKHNLARAISAELKDKKLQIQLAEHAQEITHVSTKNLCVTTTAPLSTDLQVSKTVYFKNFLTNSTPQEREEKADEIFLAQLVHHLSKRP